MAWAAKGVLDLVSGSGDPYMFNRIGDALFLLAAVVALVGVFRRLPVEYGAYCITMLIFPLSGPAAPSPLMFMPRFSVVLFPLDMWFGLWLSEGGRCGGRVRRAGSRRSPTRASPDGFAGPVGRDPH